MNDIEQLLIERACERLIIASATYNDQREWASLAALYTDDGVVVRPSGQRLVGRTDIEAAYAAGPEERVTRHVCANLRVDVDGPDAAHATTVVVIVSGTRTADPGVAYGVATSEHHVVGEFADRFVRTPLGWRIAERRASIVMNT